MKLGVNGTLACSSLIIFVKKINLPLLDLLNSFTNCLFSEKKASPFFSILSVFFVFII